MTKMYHMCMDIRGFIRNNRYPRGYLGVFKDDDGKPMTPREAQNFLFDELSKGRAVIPCSPCDNFDYQTGCQGHPAPEEEA